ncbi:MAG: hypothetical protein HYZ29_24645 [Myxococcales bacterium]|nr:hypothetical protein [Myxococcales bacterium]
MFHESDETERPGEWLRRFAEDASAHRALLAQSNSLAIAAYRLARARCRVQPMSASVPTLSELKTAADEIALRAELEHGHHLGVLVADCALAGLPIILPPSFGSAA